MKRRGSMTARWIGVAGGVLTAIGLAGCGGPRAARASSGAGVRVALARALPPLDGGHPRVTLLEVSYGPGGSSPPHSHPCPVVGYIISGALRVGVRGQPESTYTAGQAFYEAPHGVHLVSANASDRDSVRFLAWFTCNGDTVLSVPPAGPVSSARRP